jgi:hypothetical protein
VFFKVIESASAAEPRRALQGRETVEAALRHGGTGMMQMDLYGAMAQRKRREPE